MVWIRACSIVGVKVLGLSQSYLSHQDLLLGAQIFKLCQESVGIAVEFPEVRKVYAADIVYLE